MSNIINGYKDKRDELLASAIDDLEIVLDYLSIAREEKRKKKVSSIKSTNEEIIERAYLKLKELNGRRW